MNSSNRLHLSAIVTTAIIAMQTGAIAALPNNSSFQAMSLSENAGKLDHPNLLKADDDDTPKTPASGRGSRRDVSTKSDEDDTPKTRTIGRGSRGVCNSFLGAPSPSAIPESMSLTTTIEAENLLTPLAPERGVGATTASHPVFFWYLPESAPIVRFALIDSQRPRPLFRKEFQNPSAGIMQVELPKTLPSLVPGRNLRWKVTVICNPNEPSANIVAEAWVKYTPITPELNRQIQAVSGSQLEQLQQQAQIFQTAGLWYDALQALMKARAIAPTNVAIQQELSRLMAAQNLKQVIVQDKPTANTSL